MSYLETRPMPRKFRNLAALALVAAIAPFTSASRAAASPCTNPAVSSMRPTGDGRVEIVVKNASAAASPKASIQLTYINQEGKETKGPALAIASIKPHGSTVLHAPWPSYADSIHTQITCPASS